MRRKLLWGRMAWRLLVALILALYLVPIGSSPVAALDTVSVGGYFEITYEPVEFSKTEINGSESFEATVEAEAVCTNDLPLSVSEARIIARVVAEHQVSGAKVTLNSSYTVTISSFPNKEGETSSASRNISLQFPEGSQSGTYSVVGELIEAKVKVDLLNAWINVTSFLPSSQVMGSVTYTAPGGGGGFGPALIPTGEEVKTNLFGTEASSPISSSGEILETIEATSEDGTLTLTIPEGTIALDKDDNPLISLEADIDTSPPPLPEDTSIIGLAYDFGPDGATFSPPMTIEFTVDPATLPPGVAVEDLVITYYDEETGEWVELTTTYDPATNTFTAEVSHFTTFAIIGVVASAPESEPEVPVAVFRIAELDISPSEVDIGQMVTISVLVINSGNLKDTYQVTLEIDNKVVETQEVTLAGGVSGTVTFKISEDVASIYSVNIDGLSGSFVVKPAAISEPESASTPTLPATHTPLPTKSINWSIAYGVVVALVAMGSLLFFLARRSHTKSSS